METESNLEPQAEQKLSAATQMPGAQSSIAPAQELTAPESAAARRLFEQSFLELVKGQAAGHCNIETATAHTAAAITAGFIALRASSGNTQQAAREA